MLRVKARTLLNLKLHHLEQQLSEDDRPQET